MIGMTGIDVIIPVYKPDVKLKQLLEGLQQQTLPADHILLINTEEQYFDPELICRIPQARVVHISKQEFDHGGTRNMAAGMLEGEFILYMTQDAVPSDTHLIENLYHCFQQKETAAAYARQLPAGDCSVLERISRSFNYGKKSMVKTAADLPVLGIKTFFCSNVCAMYRRSVYEALGGFEDKTIFNEDMIYAGHVIRAGYAIAYCAKARVIHSHNYSGCQQLHRNFDLGVSQAEHPEIFDEVPSEGEGIRLVKTTAGLLLKSGRVLELPRLIWVSGCKWIGYRLGKGYRRLPKWLILKLTMNKGYWE